MTNYREILRQHSLGISNSAIAASGLCARQTVITILRKAEYYGLSWPLPDEMTNEVLAKKLFPNHNLPDNAYMMPDCEWIHNELKRPNVTLQLLWYEYYSQCEAAGKLPYQLTQFKKYYRDYAIKQNLTMHLEHKPGDVMQVDWAGDTLSMTDTTTGEVLKLYLFVCTLPYSGYTYVEPFLNMKLENWITAHVNAFQFFGGVPHVIQCDNLKTGVVSNTKSDTVLNRSYQDMAEHYSVAILAARVRKPKDKAHVEGAVGIASRKIIAALRNQTFLSEKEAKEAVAEKLKEYNDAPYQAREGSRRSAFEEEKPFLAQLPNHPYELCEWKKAIPQLNYHITVDKQNYSVPCEYVKREVDVRVTKDVIEVFYDGNRICSHVRLKGREGQYSTNVDHMPKAHQEYLQWNGERFRRWAEKIGTNTYRVVDSILSRAVLEQQVYKSCMSLLKLADKYTPEKLENACARVLKYTTRPSYKNVNEVIKNLPAEELVPPKAVSSEHGFVRGADYYGKEGN